MWQCASTDPGGGVNARGGCGSGCGGGIVRLHHGRCRQSGEHHAVHQLAGGADDARAGRRPADRRPYGRRWPTSNVPVGCSTTIGAALGELGDLGGRAAGQQRGGGDAHRAEHTDRVVAAVRDERAGAEAAAFARRGDERQLRHGERGDVAEVHHRADGEPDALEHVAEVAVGLQLGRLLVAGHADVVGPQHDDRHPVVDQRDRDALDDVDGVARSAAARRTTSRPCRRSRAGSARPRPARRRSRCRPPRRPRRRARRGVATATPPVFSRWIRTARLAVGWRRHEATLDGERRHAGEDVAAVLLVGDDRLVDDDLEEEVVDVGVRVATAGRPRRPCWSAGGRRPCRRSGGCRANPSPRAGRSARCVRVGRAGRRPGSRGPSTSRPASPCNGPRGRSSCCRLPSWRDVTARYCRRRRPPTPGHAAERGRILGGKG